MLIVKDLPVEVVHCLVGLVLESPQKCPCFKNLEVSGFMSRCHDMSKIWAFANETIENRACA